MLHKGSTSLVRLAAIATALGQVGDRRSIDPLLTTLGDDELTRATVEHAQTSGELWCGGSTFKGKAVIRLSVCSWATGRDDIERSVQALVQARIAAAAS